jgi:hypothetical protein
MMSFPKNHTRLYTRYCNAQTPPIGAEKASNVAASIGPRNIAFVTLPSFTD